MNLIPGELYKIKYHRNITLWYRFEMGFKSKQFNTKELNNLLYIKIYRTKVIEDYVFLYKKMIYNLSFNQSLYIIEPQT